MPDIVIDVTSRGYKSLGEGYYTDSEGVTLHDAKVQFQKLLPGFYNKPVDMPFVKPQPQDSAE